MPKSRYLTKSRYKLAKECPTKLFYSGKKDLYDDDSLDDSFLQALAYGGFQVGELAKIYYPDGHMIESLDYDESVKLTQNLLKRPEVTIYEAAFCYQDLFVRVDVLVKRGNSIQLIEVKSKSFDPTEEDSFYDKTALKRGKKKIRSNWLPYLQDIAFQTYVVRQACPKLQIVPYLMMADKSQLSSVEGLNQRFLLIEGQSGRSSVKVKPGTDLKTVGNKILCTICVAEEVNILLEANPKEGSMDFEKEVLSFANAYAQDQKITPILGPQCKSCQFNSVDPKRSGFYECWKKEARLNEQELAGPFVFDVWFFRKAKELIESGIYLMKDIPQEMINIRASDGVGLSMSERQWLQIEACAKGQPSPYVDHEGLRSAIKKFKFPLHFIDFETAMVAIPFNKDRRPYEQIAFQFSHHQVNSDGTVIHQGQYLNSNIEAFPNFDFVRALKKELENDDGTIFRYAYHENTVLCQIYDQLIKSSEADKDELCEWIKTITTSKDDDRGKWIGSRSMVDMCEMIKLYYYHPQTNGSNSIKKVLPAILQESKDLRQLYMNSQYGSKAGCKSLNFTNWQWIHLDGQGKVIDPYKLLPPIFEGVDTDKLDRLFGFDELAEGGAAMMAYAKMQFTEMSDEERQAIVSALLRYCELDTLAMVMIWQYWVEILGEKGSQKVA